MTDDRQAAWFAEGFARFHANVASVIRGKEREVRLALTALFAEGHLLLEDYPGTGKTSLAKAIAGSMQGKWNRIQFTPDLLPSDVTGVMIYRQQDETFDFHPGAVFANVVLADEINRASPKTQSALLEVMEEHQVTVDSVPHPVPRPFVVLATQNPIEQDGTYRLPEAQLDRFLMRIGLGYLDATHEVEVLAADGAGPGLEHLEPVLNPQHVEAMIGVARGIHVPQPVNDYIARLGAASRRLPRVRLGVSTRGCLALMRAARVYAASEGLSYVITDHVREVAKPVLNHRLLLTPEAELKRVSPADLVDELLANVPAPPLERTPA